MPKKKQNSYDKRYLLSAALIIAVLVVLTSGTFTGFYFYDPYAYDSYSYDSDTYSKDINNDNIADWKDVERALQSYTKFNVEDSNDDGVTDINDFFSKLLSEYSAGYLIDINRVDRDARQNVQPVTDAEILRPPYVPRCPIISERNNEECTANVYTQLFLSSQEARSALSSCDVTTGDSEYKDCVKAEEAEVDPNEINCEEKFPRGGEPQALECEMYCIETEHCSCEACYNILPGINPLTGAIGVYQVPYDCITWEKLDNIGDHGTASELLLRNMLDAQGVELPPWPQSIANMWYCKGEIESMFTNFDCVERMEGLEPVDGCEYMND